MTPPHQLSPLFPYTTLFRSVTLPLKGPQGKTEQPQLRRFHAHIYFPPEQIFVSQAEGILCGVRVSATGQLIKRADYRSEEHTSELQSHHDLVCRLLLEKKNT